MTTEVTKFIFSRYCLNKNLSNFTFTVLLGGSKSKEILAVFDNRNITRIKQFHEQTIRRPIDHKQ